MEEKGNKAPELPGTLGIPKKVFRYKASALQFVANKQQQAVFLLTYSCICINRRPAAYFLAKSGYKKSQKAKKKNPTHI